MKHNSGTWRGHKGKQVNDPVTDSRKTQWQGRGVEVRQRKEGRCHLCSLALERNLQNHMQNTWSKGPVS